MKPPEKIEAFLRQANCEAPDALRQRLWRDINQESDRSSGADSERGHAGIWRILMNSKITRLAVAAVVVVAALAVGVERLTRNKPDAVQAFSARIQANMALDLDPEAALPLREAQPNDFDVTWTGENGGTLQILDESSLRILACPLIDPQWDGAISWSYANLNKLQESSATQAVPTKREPFVAVLTSEGNLAVIEVGGHDESQAWLQWRIEKAASPGYGPTQTLTLQIVDSQAETAQNGAVDLDTGRVLSIPADVLALPAAEMLTWLEQNGVDAIARKTDEGYGLAGVGLVFWTWSPGDWSDTDAVDLREEMASASFQPRRPLVYEEDQYQHTYPFRTREGAIGMLQMLTIDAEEQTVQFRYRLVQDDPTVTVETTAPDDAESQRLAESLDKMMEFAIVLCVYADRHDRALPDTLAELKEYVEKCGQDYAWIAENVGYIGAGKKMGIDPSVPVAYDKTLAAQGKGTYVLYSDPCAQFWNPQELAARGILGSAGASPK